MHSIKCKRCHLTSAWMFVISGNLELCSTTMFTPPPQQSQRVHQKGGVLDSVQHHSRKPSSDSGKAASARCCVSFRGGLLFCVCVADNISSLQNVIDANIFPVLIEILQKAEFRTRKEAAWAITNATSGGTPAQIRCISRLKHCGSP